MVPMPRASRKASVRLLALVGVVFAGCGGNEDDSGATHCGTVPPNDACIEYRMLTPANLEVVRSACPPTAWGGGQCPKGGLGGCRVVPLTVWDEVNWYYAGSRFNAAADVMTECDAAGGTFVAPR
jgi:hypothetical protein